MGFKLPHPLIPGASPLVDDLDTVKRLEDASTPLIVMHSLFEEQIINEELYFTRVLEHGEFSTPEALGYFPQPSEFALGTNKYLQQIGGSMSLSRCADPKAYERANYMRVLQAPLSPSLRTELQVRNAYRSSSNAPEAAS